MRTLLLLTLLSCAACGTGSTTSSSSSSSGSTGSTGSSGTSGGTSGAVTVKATCSPSCGATEYCLEPGACTFDAKCVPQSEVTCPDAGLCNAPGCAGELAGTSVRCICR